MGARRRPRRRVDLAAQGAPRLPAPEGGRRERPRLVVGARHRALTTTASPGAVPSRGMALIAVPHDCYAIVRFRVVRDSIHAGPTRAMDLDCLECGACCRDNRVVLEDVDIARFDAGRTRRARAPPYARRDDGSVVLVLRQGQALQAPGGRQQVRHLRRSVPTRAARSPSGASAACRRAKRSWASSTALRRPDSTSRSSSEREPPRRQDARRRRFFRANLLSWRLWQSWRLGGSPLSAGAYLGAFLGASGGGTGSALRSAPRRSRA